MKLSKALYLFGIFSLLVGFTAPRAYALPTQEIEIYYYSDENYENQVGYLFRGCQGGVYREGQLTQYAERTTTPCDSGQLQKIPYTEIPCFVDGVLTTCPANICDSELFECY